MITVSAAHPGMRHPPGFRIDRPDGTRYYVLLRFLDPVLIDQPGGPATARAGDCLIVAPSTPHRYGGDGVGLANDWAHFAGAEVAPLLRRLGLPANRVLRPAGATFIGPMVAQLRDELVHRARGWEEVLDLTMRRLLLLLARDLTLGEGLAPSPRRIELLGRLREARMAMLNAPGQPWSIAALARRVHLSPSRFSALYRQFFAATPIEDLLRARLDQARWLLANTTLPVGEVAAQCGFQSPQYFCRLFRRREGRPPGHYARRP